MTFKGGGGAVFRITPMTVSELHNTQYDVVKTLNPSVWLVPFREVRGSEVSCHILFLTGSNTVKCSLWGTQADVTMNTPTYTRRLSADVHMNNMSNMYTDEPYYVFTVCYLYGYTILLYTIYMYVIYCI